MDTRKLVKMKGRFIDAEPILREAYEKELTRLRSDRGDPATVKDRIILWWAVQRLRSRYFGLRAWIAWW